MKFVYAYWVGNISDRKSTTGYTIMLGNPPVLWSSRKQHSVSLSPTEVEFIAASEPCKESVWFSQLFCEIENTKKKNQFTIYKDKVAQLWLKTSGSVKDPNI